ncbi:restriction endonuclease subunit S [Sporosarcina sp. P18a]|uniref:restriction endonuclease subunit S n=1 Tax=Sporosarcina sp. P18a TaxID=2048259 RepID=UPI0011819DB9|nr:restriction endonuclease subunit S [Sporosarcina sp. P18a]
MKENKLVPKRRFTEFQNADGWEQRILGQDITLRGGATPSKVNPKYWNGPISWLSSQEIKNRYISKGTHTITNKAVEDNTTRIVKAGTPLIVSRSGILVRLFPISIPTVDVAINQDIKALIFDNNIISRSFLVAQLQKNTTFILESIVKTGTTVQSINIPDFIKLQLFYPEKKEQQKIGNFFKHLDQMISLEQRKLEKTKALKSAYLAEMFPAEGERVPKRRFAGFKDEWQEWKLGDLAEIVRGASPRPIQDPKWFDMNSNIGWLRISDVTEQNGRINYLKQRLSILGQGKTRVLNKPHLLLSIAATVGKPVVNYVETGVHDGFLIFMNPKFDREFMFQWLEMFRPMWNKYGQPGSQVNLNSDIVKRQMIAIPSIEEQEMISEFFKKLDDSITNQQKQLDKLKAMKQAYLQEMFV